MSIFPSGLDPAYPRWTAYNAVMINILKNSKSLRHWVRLMQIEDMSCSTNLEGIRC
jgi:hypothetical protein